MEPRRVVVTGAGVISALGRNLDEFWQSILKCRSGEAPIESVKDARLSFKNAAEVRDFDPAQAFWADRAIPEGLFDARFQLSQACGDASCADGERSRCGRRWCIGGRSREFFARAPERCQRCWNCLVVGMDLQAGLEDTDGPIETIGVAMHLRESQTRAGETSRARIESGM